MTCNLKDPMSRRHPVDKRTAIVKFNRLSHLTIEVELSI